MHSTFWAGVGLGAGLGLVVTAGVWLFTTKVLVARLKVVSKVMGEKQNGAEYFDVANVGFGDAIDVTVSCTLFSVGWGNDSERHTATIDIPVSVMRIDIMPGKYSLLRLIKPRRIDKDKFRYRQITLEPQKMTEKQKKKLVDPQLRQKLTKSELRLADIMGLGEHSLLYVVAYAFNRFSGTRSITGTAAFEAKANGAVVRVGH